ncbi:hypothetical protein [Priestia koreensis]|uniref:hypothetical protein n=1 Tax=Priestia koreensis TaxID=284581 RepID=UPI001F59B077|nr:hypothetical protein [Priestia koreensis]MCM3006463.1 hypothetical protein [Priestia koreensis]UNL83636.1 hypothetical protein IE339_15875 [Priestia koreensis]
MILNNEQLTAFGSNLNEWRKNEDYYFEFEYGEIDTGLIELEMIKIQYTHILDFDDFMYVILDVHYDGSDINLFMRWTEKWKMTL